MSAEDPIIGQTLLGRYRVVSRLARGGMGVIYLARSEGAAGFVQPVVIKRILPELDDEDAVGMFGREARILGQLRHPGVAGIVEFAEEGGAYLMVLEYVHGYDLGKWRRYVADQRGSFDLELALHVIIKILDALHYAHTRTRADGSSMAIIHRDISPSNIVVDTEAHVKLLDFGVARMQGDNLYKTETFMVKGKLSYIAPELLDGASPDPSSDVYACAVVLHELLLGRNEFRASSTPATVRRVLMHVPSRISDVREDVATQLDDVLARALAKVPGERIASAEDFAAALREIRVLTTEEAHADLLATIREDYAALPGHFRIEPLEERERRWQKPQDPASPVAQQPWSTSEAPTSAAAPREPTTVARSGRGGRIGIAVAASLAAIATTIGALFGLGVIGGAPSGPEQVFVVQQTSEHEGPREVDVPDGPGPDAAPPAERAPDEEADPPTVTARARRGGGRGRRTPPRGEALTATFARQRRPVEACLRQHASAITGRPRLAVRFTLAASGAVRSAELLPREVGATELGRCVTRVARSVQFAPQDRDGVSFRIPLTVERR